VTIIFFRYAYLAKPQSPRGVNASLSNLDYQLKLPLGKAAGSSGRRVGMDEALADRRWRSPGSAFLKDSFADGDPQLHRKTI